MNDIEKTIIKKSKELSTLLQTSDIAKKYIESIEKMKSDSKSQKLMERLVVMGKELNDKLVKGEDLASSSVEKKLLEDELKENLIVREHLSIQKEYLNLIQKVQEKIKNPTK